MEAVTMREAAGQIGLAETDGGADQALRQADQLGIDTDVLELIRNPEKLAKELLALREEVRENVSYNYSSQMGTLYRRVELLEIMAERELRHAAEQADAYEARLLAENQQAGRDLDTLYYSFGKSGEERRRDCDARRLHAKKAELAESRAQVEEIRAQIAKEQQGQPA